MAEKLYTVYQVADLLGSTPTQVLDWVQKGRISCRGEEGHRRITEAGLIQFLKNEGIDIEQVLAKAVLGAAPKKTRSAAEVSAGAEDGELVVVDPAERLAEAILKDAVSRRAEAIHLEPVSGGLALRLRVDGVLQEKVNFRLRLPPAIAQGLTAHFEKKAGLSGKAPAGPDAGRFTATVGGRAVQFRATACPTQHGRRLVVFVMDGEAGRLGLKELGLGQREEAILRRGLAERSGLLLVTARPRGGATTTLRAMAGELAGRHRGIFWIGEDDPATMGEVNWIRPDGGGLDGAASVRAAADQDPDVIVIDALWDRRTLAAAAEAALAGGLVIGRLHERSATAALELLRGAGVEPGRLAAGLLAVSAQTTVRRLCPACKRQAEASAPAGDRPGPRREAPAFTDFAPEGCAQCYNTGYKGRTGAFSVLEVNEEVAGCLREAADIATISAVARRGGMKTLPEAAIELARRGETSLEELGGAASGMGAQ